MENVIFGQFIESVIFGQFIERVIYRQFIESVIFGKLCKIVKNNGEEGEARRPVRR